MLIRVATFFVNMLFKLHFKGLIDIIKQRYQKARIDEVKKELKSVGTSFWIKDDFIILNAKYMAIGNNFNSLDNLRMEAYDNWGGEHFEPFLSVGHNVSLGTNVHIGCINKVIIGSNVLMASNIYISDHSHGAVSNAALRLPPGERPLVSKGPVIIEDNVWIGEGVCILPGVIIGRNSIIGANSVVTKSVQPNSVIGGIPGKTIRMLC
jgi:acetyltransferase-like isoleucine patch superfamily enzyme